MAGLDDLQRLSFNGIDLHKYCPDLRDSFGPRFAGRTLWGRDGARQEEGGNAPRRCKVKLNFAGDEWQSDISRVLGGIVARPRGTLIHPILGSFQAVCKQPIEASFDPSQKGACYEVDLTFEEDAYDKRITFEKGPAGQAQEVTRQTSLADEATVLLQTTTYAKYTIGPVAIRLRRLVDRAVELTGTFTSAANSYAATALEQFNSGVWDPSLETQLKTLPTLAKPAIQGVRPLGHQAYDATTAINLALKAATDMDLAVRASFPIPIMYPIRQKMSLFDVCQVLYPHKTKTQRLALWEQILRINRLDRPDVLLPSRIIQVPAP